MNQKTPVRPHPSRHILPHVLATALALALALPLAACTTAGPTDTSGDSSASNPAQPNGGSEGSEDENSQGTPSSSTPAPVTFTDALGTQVTVDNPQRVVACMGSLAAIWELSGGQLVGVTNDALLDYSLNSPAIDIGDFSSPNLESIIALEPDFVILTAASTGRAGTASQTELKEGLEASGITAAYFEVTVFEDYLAMLDICTQITGLRERYDAYGTNQQIVIDRIIEKAAPAAAAAPAPTVLLMATYSGGTRVQDSSTMTGAMLAELGADNLASSNPSLLKDFSLEAIIERDPQYIFVIPMGNDEQAALENLNAATEANPAWAGLDAVKNNRYLTLDPSLFLYKPNDRWSEAYQVLYDALYS
ncbi:MAG: ABC transporter substrate-binding protein [Coriobacteriales bacterium]|jgi:iron complex transport system substrate-binding protein|nr:ABC transporter substrate-binding protein [Coriobacteriales bacterium]